MAANQLSRRTLVLALVTIGAAAVLVAIWPAQSADTRGSTPGQADGTPAVRLDQIVPPPVALDRLAAQPPAPANRRELFRFGSAEPDPAVAGTEPQPQVPGRRGGRATPPPSQPEPPPGPVMPPPPPPIPLRYIGFMETEPGKPMGGLVDASGTVFLAREGSVIEGQWRVIRITADLIVIERLDGTGRQTIRHNGG